MDETSRPEPARAGGGLWPSLWEPLRSAVAALREYFAPSADAGHTADAYEINIELPGVAKDDAEVTLNEDVLTVTGEKRSEREERAKTYFICERAFGAFQRSFRLPENVDAGRIAASFEDGVVKLTLPKLKSPRSSERRIKIQAGRAGKTGRAN